jgi:hypothetical protein
MLLFLVTILSNKIMYNVMISSLCPESELKGTLLTREQVEDISNRISDRVSENVSKQLEKAMSSEIRSPKEKNNKE